MCQLVLVLLAVFTGYAGAATIERCCSQKMVGGVNYTLVNTWENTTMYGCEWDCVYEQNGLDGSRVCFKEGGLPVVCYEDDNAGVCMCHEGPVYPFNECAVEYNQCRGRFSPVCITSFPNCGASGGCRCLPVSPYNFCNTSLTEINCQVCLDKCTPDGTNECYECIRANCNYPETLAACGFDGDDAEGGFCIFTNAKYNGDPIGIPNTVAHYKDCQSQCLFDNTCTFWNGRIEAAGTLCSMFGDASGPVRTEGYFCGPINKDCPVDA